MVLLHSLLMNIMALIPHHAPPLLRASGSAFATSLTLQRLRFLTEASMPSTALALSNFSCFQMNRRYHIRTSASASRKTTQSPIHNLQPLSHEEIKRNNLISSRLYRILLRSCRNVQSTNNEGWILLQPPLDVRKYGHANIFRVNCGELRSCDNPVVSKSACNMASEQMDRMEVGRAMDVLRFVHISLGGSEDDDLEDYYLHSSPESEENENAENSTYNHNGEEELNKHLGAAAGKHAAGHYTQFLDEDEERGEGDDGIIASKDMLDQEVDEYQSQHEDIDDEDYHINMRDPSVLVHARDIANAIRIAFRAPILPAEDSPNQTSMQSIITRRHRDAIDAFSLFSEQIDMWAKKSSVSINQHHGVRIVATSTCLHLSTPAKMGGRKYKFAYRIRVENVQNEKKENNVVQLLGRTWNIYECRQTDASLLNKLLKKDDSRITLDDASEERGSIDVRTLVQNVHEPKTGAVGHFPVIRHGEVFEYISGAEISTPTGFMEGSFHMAIVDSDKVKSASIGETVDALLWKENDERKFEATVAEFGFVSDEDGQ